MLWGADTGELPAAFRQRCLFGAENGLLRSTEGAGGSSGRIHVSGGRTDRQTDGRCRQSPAAVCSVAMRTGAAAQRDRDGAARVHSSLGSAFPPRGLPEIPPLPSASRLPSEIQRLRVLSPSCRAGGGGRCAGSSSGCRFWRCRDRRPPRQRWLCSVPGASLGCSWVLQTRGFPLMGGYGSV